MELLKISSLFLIIYIFCISKIETFAIDVLEDEFQQARVIDGVEAEQHSAPFIVTLLVKNRENYKLFCGGSIITPSWILTAAHCLILPARRIHIGAGRHIINSVENSSQIIRADFHMQHDEYDVTGPFDIGLIHLRKPFEVNEYIQPIALSSRDHLEGISVLFGWGSITKTQERNFPNELQTVNLTLVDNHFCQSHFAVEISDDNVCAGEPEEGKGACVGDSGGPLLQDDSLIGVVSWGPLTCDPNEGPSVFTKVSSFIPWIKDILDDDANDLVIVE